MRLKEKYVITGFQSNRQITMKEGILGPAGFAWGPSLGNSYTSQEGCELDFRKQE